VSSFETRESSNSDLTFASSRSNRSKGSLLRRKTGAGAGGHQ
jgi:hypothetical protein